MVTLAGCASVPALPSRPAVPATWHHLPPDAMPAPADLRAWWHAFGDAKLNALVDRALADNLEVAQAAARLRAARILVTHAHDAQLPALHVRTNDVINPDTSASYFLMGFDARWELPLFGAWQSAQRVAQGQAQSAQAQWQGARVSLVAEVVRRWLELRAAQRQAQTLDTMQVGWEEKRRLLEVRHRLKLASPVELARVQAELAHLEIAHADARQAITRSAQQLAVLVGQNEPDTGWLDAGPQPFLGEWHLTSAPADMLRTRPEIALAEAEVLRTAGELGLSRAEMYPRVGLGTSLQWSVNVATNRSRTRTGESIFSAGPAIDIPLFDWGRRVANAHAKDHELQAALFAYRQAVLQGVAETEIALDELEQSGQRERAASRGARAVQISADAMRRRATLGLASGLDVQDGLIEEQRAALEVITARAARGIAYVTLYKALGGAPWPASSPDPRSLTPAVAPSCRAFPCATSDLATRMEDMR